MAQDAEDRSAEAERRARQQTAVARLGQDALSGSPLGVLVEQAARAAARELGTEYAAVLALAGNGGDELLMRAAVGFPDDALEQARPQDPDDLTAAALRAGQPVVVEDLGAGGGIEASALQQRLGVTSAMAAPIAARGRQVGVIAVHDGLARTFTADDAEFLAGLAGVLGAAADRARHEDVIRDSESLFRELADTTPALMWMTDADGDVTFVNDAWLRFTGRALEEEVGDTFASSAHPGDRERLLEAWREASRRRDELRLEYRLRHAPSGRHRWVLESGIPRFARGEFLGYVGTATDIHERRAMEEALRESEASFRDLADTAPVMLWTTDPKGDVTFVNEGWLRWTGTRLEDELGPSWALGVHPKDQKRVLTSWGEALAARRPWELEYRLRSRSGEYRWVVDRGVPRYEGGVFVGYVGAASDIHERKTIEGQLLAVAEREHDIAATLQRSLLPQRLPAIEGVDLEPRYLPAARGASVGGDWYDALERPDGRLALVVGDVVGHGLRAAAVMGQLRNAFRAYGLVEASPAEVLARLNRLVTVGVEEAMATVLYLVLDRDSGEVVFTCAGHPPPLVIGPSGTRFLEGGRSLPVGAADPAVFREGRARLEPGSTLLLYTDGLVERRDVPLGQRLERLAATAEPWDAELPELCDRVISGVLGGGEPRDDVALLAVRPRAAGADRISVSLPAEPESLAGLRRRLSRFLHAAGASDIEVYEITLAVCEAAGNAIEHAYGPADANFDVDAALAGDELAATVRDHGHWRERRSEHRGRGLRIIEGLMDAVDVSTADDGTVVTMRRRLEAARAA